MTLTILLTLLGTSIDTILLCYCTKYFNFRYSYIKSGILYTLWSLSIVLLNLLSCPFIFKLIYELFSIIFLNRYLYLDFQLKSTLKMIVVFYIVLCLCELLTVGICFSVLHCISLSDIFDNQVLSLEMIIFSKILSLLLLHFVFYHKQNDIEISFTPIESILYFLPIITCLLLILGIIYLLKISNISSQYHEVFLWISIVLMISSFCHFILFNLYLSKKAEENYINFVKSQEEKTFYYYQQKQKDIEDLRQLIHMVGIVTNQRNGQIIAKAAVRQIFFAGRGLQVELLTALHDLKNQLLALKSQPAESNQYTQHIDSLLNDLSKSSSAIHTGNPFIDVLISEKLKLIHEQHISCKMNVELENIHFIRNIELCSLLGNLLDNCIEATQCCDKNKSITFCCNTTQNHFCIHASNTYNKKLKYKNGSFITTKKDSSMHGFGIISIKRIVSKYNGNVSFSSNLEEFVVNISIPLPQNLN